MIRFIWDICIWPSALRTDLIWTRFCLSLRRHRLSFADRLTMTAIAVADEPDFEVSAIEALREGKSYTYDTILTLKRMYLAWEIYFLSGADALDNFARWYNWRGILENCYLAVFSRPGYELKLAQDWQKMNWQKKKFCF